jgi:hypothetical protein
MMQKNVLPPSSVLKMDTAATATLIPPMKLYGLFSFAVYFTVLSVSRPVIKLTYYAGMPGELSKTTRNLSPDSQCPGRDLNLVPLHYTRQPRKPQSKYSPQ